MNTQLIALLLEIPHNTVMAQVPHLFPELSITAEINKHGISSIELDDNEVSVMVDVLKIHTDTANIEYLFEILAELGESTLKSNIQAYSDSPSHAIAAKFYKISDPTSDDIITQLEYLGRMKCHLKMLLKHIPTTELKASLEIVNSQIKWLSCCC